MTAQARLTHVWPPLVALPPEPGELGPELCAHLDRASKETIALSALWSDLVSNRFRVGDCFFSETRCFLVLKPVSRSGRPDRRLAVRKVRVLERILLGEGQKAVALSLRVAPSTVTLMSGECLRAMGLDCRTSRVPMVLVMGAHAARDLTDFRWGTLSDVTIGDAQLRIIGLPRPDADLPEQLSPAECVVARALVEGKRHAEIALARETSTRTIANQLASAFHKLRVSGRAELLCRLIRRPGTEHEVQSLPVSELPVRRREPRYQAASRAALARVRALQPRSPARDAETVPAP
jgi:DNA-binding NarL/FixJ family response regulator